MTKTQLLGKLVLCGLLLSTTGLASSAGSGILHGFVVDGAGAPVTDLTAVVTHLDGQFPFSGTQALGVTGEFVLQPTIGSYLIELEDASGNVVDYRTGVNIFNDITTFQFFTVDQPTECQTNLGFGMPGGMTLTVCGDDLTTADSSAELSIYNATPNQTVFAFLGAVNAPTPLMGGTLVPFPWLKIFLLTADTGGQIHLTVPGSAAPPVTVYLQVVDNNGAGLRFSNAVEVVLGL